VSNSKQRNRRNRLFAQNPVCHWCGVLTSHPHEYGAKAQNGLWKLQNPKYHMATLDHLDSKLNPNRGKRKGKKRTVLACIECNEYRSYLELTAVPLQELHRRAANTEKGRIDYYLKYGEYPEETRPYYIPQEYRPA
jgi:hypothetical protein